MKKATTMFTEDMTVLDASINGRVRHVYNDILEHDTPSADMNTQTDSRYGEHP